MSATPAIRLFGCFDAAQDADLLALFRRQCGAPGSTLAVVDWSREEEAHAGWEDKLRARLERVDAFVVLCGEGTHAAGNVNREFGIAQQSGKPYVLVWGRRSASCTRPAGALATDHFYTWTWDVLNEQIQGAIRHKLDPLGIERATLLGLRTKRP
ncbi:MAG: hypothetical protein DCC71_04985 [Proteobacteria bacterium]|nr:MAG: hypothetical protein DCC71_04985 [Pseudomonadota bacterium]